MSRYKNYNYILKSLQISKFNLNNKNFTSLKSLELQAGHFKLNQFYSEYGLLFYSLTNQFPNIKIFKHGKRLKNTVILYSEITDTNKWHVLNKFIYEFLPLVSNISIISQKRKNKLTNKYSLRIRSYFEFEEIDTLITDRLIKRDIFLPIFFNITLSNNNKLNNENYLRMLRLPIIY